MNQPGSSDDTRASSDERDTLPPSDAAAESLSDGVELVSPPAGDETLPEEFGRYCIERALGQGAMGTVYLARDTELDRRVALKVPRFADAESLEYRERFYREARSAATLRHAHICPIYDVGEIDGKRYISMAYVEGRLLSELIPYAPRDAAQLVRKLALALQHAHRRGVIHRDLKPSNIMIDEDGEPIIMDFGLARRVNRAEERRLTHSGVLLGSPAYMSPEQIEDGAGAVGPASDVYSLGVLLYELLTGELPFNGSVASVIGQIITSEPPKPSEKCAGLDPRLEAICLQMMAKSCDRRYASMEQAAGDLLNFLENKTIGEADVPVRDTSLSDAGETTPSTVTATVDPSAATVVVRERVGIPRAFLWAGIGLISVGFGLTWWMMSIALQPADTDNNRIEFDNTFRQGLAEQEASLFIDGEEVDIAQLDKPIPLETGTHVVEVRSGDRVLANDDYVVGENENLVLNIKYNGGLFVIEKERIEDGEEAEAEPDGEDVAPSDDAHGEDTSTESQ